MFSPDTAANSTGSPAEEQQNLLKELASMIGASKRSDGGPSSSRGEGADGSSPRSMAIVDRVRPMVEDAKAYAADLVATQVRNLERDLQLVEAKQKEACLEIKLKQERLEKLLIQERSRGSLVSAAYAAAERRGRGL